MGLNPLRDTLGTLGTRASESESAFKAVADSALASFRVARRELEARVRRGDLTVKAAREAARAAADQITGDLLRQSTAFTPAPRLFLERLTEASSRRAELRKHRSVEDLQRETNQLLRQTLVEQQMQARQGEFESQSYVRPLAGGAPATTLGSLLRFHDMATIAGDDAAVEWSRRQLEGMRGKVFTDEERSMIDQACDRPDRINSRLVVSYLERLASSSVDEIEVFLTQAIDRQDTNSCIALFVHARQSPADALPTWARRALQNLDLFPDAALAALRGWEAEARAIEEQAARSQAEFAASLAAAEAGLPSLKTPSDHDILRQAEVGKLPAADGGEPVGLALRRRGLTPEEYALREQARLAAEAATAV
jgi:hypothetical protein